MRERNEMMELWDGLTPVFELGVAGVEEARYHAIQTNPGDPDGRFFAHILWRPDAKERLELSLRKLLESRAPEARQKECLARVIRMRTNIASGAYQLIAGAEHLERAGDRLAIEVAVLCEIAILFARMTDTSPDLQVVHVSRDRNEAESEQM